MGRRFPLAIALALLVAAALPHAALALCSEVDRQVTTTADVTDPSDGVLSLREAVALANSNPGTARCEHLMLPAGHYTLTQAAGGTLAIATPNYVLVAAEDPIKSSREVVIDGGGTVGLFSAGSTGPFAIDRVTLTNGAPALMNDGQTNISRTTITHNHASVSGGAIVNSASGQLQIDQSTLSDNHATSTSGSISGGAILNNGFLGFYASTLAGNTVGATTAKGGAVYNNGTLTVQHTTFAGNAANTLSINGGGPDVFNESGKTAQTQDSVFGSGCNAQLTPVGAEGFSVGSDTTCVTVAGDLKLGPLQDNGGPTDTLMLLPGSAAIDKYTLQCDFDIDQREVKRPQGSQCDAGAYELVQTGDLGVTADAAAASVAQGATVSLAFHVASSTNPVGDSLANDAVQPTLTSVLPDGLSFAGGSAGCSAAGQTVTCKPGLLASNSPAVPVTIDVRADAAGAFTVAADVASSRPDSNSLDDRATIAVTSTAPPAPPGPPAQAKIAFAGKPKVHGDRVSFVLACSDAPCAGRARVITTERLRRHRVIGLRRPASSAATRTLSLASRTFSIAAGQRATLTLRLSKTGRKLLKRFHRLPARLSVRLGKSKTTTASSAVVFKRKR